MAQRPTRRSVLNGVLGAGMLAMPHVARAAPARLVVIGAGMGGAAFATHVARLAAGAVDITLIEPQPEYLALFRSNLVLGDVTDVAAIRLGYNTLAARVRFVRARADRIDRDRRHAILAGGARLPYDLLALAPGIAIDYDSVPGWSREASLRMPHAWKGADQFAILHKQLAAVPDGGQVVLLPPPDPSRCPPGAYERASMIAQCLKTTGRANCRITIVDCKERFAKMALFLQGWERYYPRMIVWLPPSIHDGVSRVDAATMTVETGFEIYRDCALVNVIPAQTAGPLARAAGLTDATGFCPVNPRDMRSQLDNRIFVLGDAAHAGALPKSASAAVSEARVAAHAAARELIGDTSGPSNFSSVCWSLIATGDCVKVSARYEARANGLVDTDTFVTPLDASTHERQANAAESSQWFARNAAEIFR